MSMEVVYVSMMFMAIGRKILSIGCARIALFLCIDNFVLEIPQNTSKFAELTFCKGSKRFKIRGEATQDGHNPLRQAADSMRRRACTDIKMLIC